MAWERIIIPSVDSIENCLIVENQHHLTRASPVRWTRHPKTVEANVGFFNYATFTLDWLSVRFRV